MFNEICHMLQTLKLEFLSKLSYATLEMSYAQNGQIISIKFIICNANMSYALKSYKPINIKNYHMQHKKCHMQQYVHKTVKLFPSILSYASANMSYALQSYKPINIQNCHM